MAVCAFNAPQLWTNGFNIRKPTGGIPIKAFAFAKNPKAMFAIRIKLGVAVADAVFKPWRTNERPFAVEFHAAFIIICRSVGIVRFCVMGYASKTHIVVNEV